MKYGVRKPNVKKSIKARTTGKVKRQVKKAVNPLYGKKGMGIVNDPKKAAYNAVYSRTTVGVSDVMKSASSGNGHASASYDAPAPVKKEYSDRTYNVCGIILMVLAVVLVLLGLLLLLAVPVGGVAAILLGVVAPLAGARIEIRYRRDLSPVLPPEHCP